MHRSLTSILIGNLFVAPLIAPETPELISAELKRETLDGFTRYVRATEARIEKELARPDAFLYVDGFPDARRAAETAALKGGEIYMERLKTLDPDGAELRAPGGMLHHWLGTVFIPAGTLRQTLDLARDYDHHQTIYKPEVLRSRLIRRNGDDFNIYYRLRKKRLITVTLNTEHHVHYTRVNPTRAYSRSYSTRIAEVENADQPNEGEKPVGHDSGFLWRINSYWKFEERDGGVYVECESISLTRDIPFALRWLIAPFVTEIPKESLQRTLGRTRSALLERLALTPTPRTSVRDVGDARDPRRDTTAPLAYAGNVKTQVKERHCENPRHGSARSHRFSDPRALRARAAGP